MFRRKEDELEGGTGQDMFESENNTGNGSSSASSDASKDSSAASSSSSAASGGAARPAMATPPNPAFRPQAGGPAPAAGARPASPQSPGSRPSADASTSSGMDTSSGKRILTVGPQINMKGEISSCDRLVIEGAVDATLADVDTLEIAQEGGFKGRAEVRNAEISGLFEGDLICTDRLIIYATGRITGNISYSEIEIERGGQLTGTVQFSSSGAAAKPKKAAA